MTDITQRLPLELLVEIMGHVSIPDVLKLQQVNRTFHDATLTSPLIQHKIDLFAAGFEYNPASGINLADSRKVLHQYLSHLNTLRPIEERLLEDLRLDDNNHATAVGGIYAVILRDSVRLFNLGSTSRGISRKEWEIPLPVDTLMGYGFYPVADVIAFVDLSAQRADIHLRTLSEGEQHPAAQSPVICYTRDDLCPQYRSAVLITGVRLLLLVKTRSAWHFVVWDWKNAQILLEFGQQSYGAMEFIDDYRLLVCINPTSDGPLSIVLINTEKFVGGAPVQTTFKLSPYFGEFEPPCLLIERGAHSTSPAESLAPFRQDPAQRVITLVRLTFPGSLVLRVKTLMDFLEAREGSEIRWDEWRSCVVTLSISPYYPERTKILVCGCRLFLLDSMGPGQGSRMKVYDFSRGGYARYLRNWDGGDLGVTKRLSSTGVVGRVPWDAEELSDTRSGHNSVIFSPYPNNPADRDDDGRWKRKVYIWTF